MAFTENTTPPFSTQITEIPVTLEFLDLSFSVKKDKSDVCVMHNVSGSAFPGTLTAIMGPSGAGKSTLLNLLCGRIQPKKIKGNVYLNNRPSTKLSRLITAYVMQSDIFFSELTVYETLKYTALLRLGKKLTYAEKMQRVEDVIKMFRLTKCRNTKIGNSYRRGISGGEIKRLNVANELITNPSLFMLDEPTSGLDSHAASSLVETLYHMARDTKRTVICSIHQPSSQVFHRFDRLIGVMNGHIVYQGEVKKCNEYFSSLGFKCLDGYNLADHIIDLFSNNDILDYLVSSYHNYVIKNANGEYTMMMPKSSNKIESPIHKFQYSAIASTSVSDSGQDSKKTIVEIEMMNHVKDNFASSTENVFHKFEESKVDSTAVGVSNESYTVEIDGVGKTTEIECNEHVRSENKNKSLNELIRKYHDIPSYTQQTMTLFYRCMNKELKEIIKLVDMTQTILIALLVGCIWFGSVKNYIYSRLSDRIGLLLFSTSYWCFVPAFSALSSFPPERAVIAKERASKSYKISSYLLAKSLAEIPIYCITPTIWTLIVYSMAGFPWTAYSFFGIWLSLLLNVLVGHAVGLLSSAIFSEFKHAALLVSVLLLGSMLTSGFYVKLELIPSWIEWTKWLSFMLYTMSSLLQINLNENFIECDTLSQSSATPPNGYSKCPIPSDEIIEKETNSLSIGLNVTILIAMFLLIRLICYVILRFGNKLRLQ